MADFAKALAITLGFEGGYQADPNDPGNWTGGRIGVGECNGTNFGISAAAYPTLDIKNLTIDTVTPLYRADYWVPICGDALPDPLGGLVFDAAVMSGAAEAPRWLQRIVGAVPDGDIGPRTLAAVAAFNAQQSLPVLCGQFQAARLKFLLALPSSQTFMSGWDTRVCTLPFLLA